MSSRPRTPCACCSKPPTPIPRIEAVNKRQESFVPTGFYKWENEGTIDLVIPDTPFYPPDGTRPFIRPLPWRYVDCSLYSTQNCTHICYFTYQIFVYDIIANQFLFAGHYVVEINSVESSTIYENEMNEDISSCSDDEVVKLTVSGRPLPSTPWCYYGVIPMPGPPTGGSYQGPVFSYSNCRTSGLIKPLPLCISDSNMTYPPFYSDDPGYQMKDGQGTGFLAYARTSLNEYKKEEVHTKWRITASAPATGYMKVWYEIRTRIYIQQPYCLENALCPSQVCTERWNEVTSQSEVPESLADAGYTLEVFEGSMELRPDGGGWSTSDNPADFRFVSSTRLEELTATTPGLWVSKSAKITKWSYVKGYEPAVKYKPGGALEGLECQGYPVLDPLSPCNP